MSHTSPASYLLWALLSSMLGVFLLFHLWSFDRFKCLKWNNGPSSGAFKRVMTYSYLLSVPLIIAYAVGFAAIKYHEGFIVHPVLGIIPKPYTLWGPAARRAILPLTLMFSVGWSFEMVSHLEELCFWLFLVNSGSAQQDWFRSLYFKTWVVGSAIAVTYMPLVTILTRFDPLKSEAYAFVAGSLGSLSLTLWFTPILWTFPAFLANLRSEGVDTNTIVRLTKFSELNTIRVVFRFMFTVPILILGVDGVRPHQHINESMLWTDLLAILAGFGVVISSGITLIIFFPRSIEGEIAARDAARERKRAQRSASVLNRRRPSHTTQSQAAHYDTHIGSGDTYLLTSSPVKQHFNLSSFDGHTDELGVQPALPSKSPDKYWDDEERDSPSELPTLPPIRPNRRRGQDVELGGFDSTLTENNLSRHNLKASNLNPIVHNFTSPIDLAYPNADINVASDSWLPFFGRN